MIGGLQFAHAALDALQRNADGARRGHCREQVLEIVAAGQGEVERAPMQCKSRSEKAPLDKVRGPKVGWMIDAVRDLLSFEGAADVHHVFVVDVENHRAVRRQILQQLSLRLGNLLDRPEELDVHRSDVRVDADIGMQETGENGDLALVIHSHFADDDFRVVRHVVEAERRADHVVEVPPRFERAALGSHERGDHFLRGGLAGGAGDGDQCELVPLPDRSRQLL